MRIGIVSESNGQIGGVETYLEAVVPSLLDRGHTLAFFAGSDGPPHRPGVRLPGDVVRWPAARGRTAQALAGLHAWRPDVLFAHCLEDTALEAEVFSLAPTVFFAHAYYGTCISGFKSHWFPTPRVCQRRFGPACLAHYFPHRCGGLNPATMVALYAKQRRRLRNLAACAAVVVLSEHMAAEYRRHDFAAHVLPPLFTADRMPGSNLPAMPAEVDPVAEGELRVTFLGRFEKLKGPHLLLDALPNVASALRVRVRCRLAGQGMEEGSLRQHAARLAKADPRVAVEFPGWLDAGRRSELFRDSHLLAVPSRWPEPFGLVGLEAAAHGVPTVAGDVGGVGSWLEDGVSGVVVPTVRGRLRAEDFAQAIVATVRDLARYRQLRQGARARVSRLDPVAHVTRLEQVLTSVAGRGDMNPRSSHARAALGVPDPFPIPPGARTTPDGR